MDLLCDGTLLGRGTKRCGLETVLEQLGECLFDKDCITFVKGVDGHLMVTLLFDLHEL